MTLIEFTVSLEEYHVQCLNLCRLHPLLVPKQRFACLPQQVSLSRNTGSLDNRRVDETDAEACPIGIQESWVTTR
jgi:hypothetical protein